MTKKSLIIAILFSFCFLSFKQIHNTENKVLVYGLVINYGCEQEPETTVEYAYEIVEKAKYNQASAILREKLLKQYPKAKRVETGSSFYQYGADAAAIVILKQTVFYPGKCEYYNYIIGFGKSTDEALATATKNCLTSTYIKCDVLKSESW